MAERFKGYKRYKELVEKLIVALDAKKAKDLGVSPDETERIRKVADQTYSDWRRLAAAVRAARVRWGRNTTEADVIRLAIENLAKQMGVK